MTKTILSLILILATVSCGNFTKVISTDNTNKWELSYSNNADVSSNTDVSVKLTHAVATVTSGDESSVVCVNTGVSSFTLSADKSGMKAFLAQIHFASADTLVGGNGKLYATTSDYTQATPAYSTAGSTAISNSAIVALSTATTYDFTLSNQTAANLAVFNLPNQTEKYYWKCFSAYKVTCGGTTLENDVSDLGTTFTSSTNILIDGISSNGVLLASGTFAAFTVVMITLF